MDPGESATFCTSLAGMLILSLKLSSFAEVVPIECVFVLPMVIPAADVLLLLLFPRRLVAGIKSKKLLGLTLVCVW